MILRPDALVWTSPLLATVATFVSFCSCYYVVRQVIALYRIKVMVVVLLPLVCIDKQWIIARFEETKVLSVSKLDIELRIL